MTFLLFTSAESEVEPSDADLTTLEAARAFVQKNDADTEQDAVIQQLITRASWLIQRKTRIVRPAVDDAEREVVYRGSGLVDLSPYFCRDVAAVESVAPGGSTQTLTSGDWQLVCVDPRTNLMVPAEDGAYTHLRATGLGTRPGGLRLSDPSRVGGYTQTVTVTGDWGMETVPPDLEHACLVTVKVWLSNYVSAFTRVFNEDTGAVELPEDVPRVAIRALRPYLRTGITV